MKFSRYNRQESLMTGERLANKINELITREDFMGDRLLKDYMAKASMSIMENISNTFEKEDIDELSRLLLFAKTSSSGVRTKLYVAFYQKYITREEFNELMNLNQEVSKLIGGLMDDVESNENAVKH